MRKPPLVRIRTNGDSLKAYLMIEFQNAPSYRSIDEEHDNGNCNKCKSHDE